MRRVAAAVIVEAGCLFVTRRGPDEKLAGCWELPGGKIESGESPQQCLQRELLEELSMSATVGGVVARTIHEYEHGSFEMLALETRRQSGFELIVHDDFAWASPDRLDTLALAPADVDLVHQLISTGVFTGSAATTL